MIQDIKSGEKSVLLGGGGGGGSGNITCGFQGGSRILTFSLEGGSGKKILMNQDLSRPPLTLK